MRHRVAGKSLNRNSAHRAALRKNFTVSVIKHERVVTTVAVDVVGRVDELVVPAVVRDLDGEAAVAGEQRVDVDRRVLG